MKFMEQILTYAEKIVRYPLPSLQREIAAVYLFNENFLRILQHNQQPSYNPDYFPTNIIIHQLIETNDLNSEIECPVVLQEIVVEDMSSYLAGIQICTDQISQLSNLLLIENPQIAQTVCDID